MADPISIFIIFALLHQFAAEVIKTVKPEANTLHLKGYFYFYMVLSVVLLLTRLF